MNKRKSWRNQLSCLKKKGGEKKKQYTQFARQGNACLGGSSCGTLLILHFSRFDELPYRTNGPKWEGRAIGGRGNEREGPADIIVRRKTIIFPYISPLVWFCSKRYIWEIKYKWWYGLCGRSCVPDTFRYPNVAARVIITIPRGDNLSYNRWHVKYCNGLECWGWKKSTGKKIWWLMLLEF